jgi:hypothetical protein
MNAQKVECVPLAIPVPLPPQPQPAAHERYAQRMFFAAWLPRTWRIPPLLAFLSTGIGAFSLLWNPNYYILQPVFWSAHIMIMVPTYLYIWRIKPNVYAHTGIPISRGYRWTTATFYGLFMAYWAYFCYLELSAHPEDPWYDQIGNAFMSIVWYIFFATASAIYYYTTTLLLQRTVAIKNRVHAITPNTTKDEFFVLYESEFEKNRRIANQWNIVIFLAILILIINIPADLLGILINKTFVALPGIVMKTAGLIWYLLAICKLNYMETYIQNYLHKHHLLQADIEEIARYMEVRRIGLNFFGLRITYELLTKIAMIGFNVILPTLYGLVSNNILKL